MDRFSKIHPSFHFVYFIGVFCLVVSVSNPVFSALALVCGLIYDLKLRGREVLSAVKFMLAILFVVSLFNMLFAHYGMDVLFRIGETKYTLEALFYGFNQGMMLSGMMLWFGIFSRIMDSERVIYVLRFAPKLALIFSMVLGLIPRLNRKLSDIRSAQQGLNGGEKPKGKREALSQGLSSLSALVSASLEGSIITADSMSARGYNPKAVRYSRYKLKAFDAFVLVASIALIVYCAYGIIAGRVLFVFDPRPYIYSFDYTVLVCFIILLLMPIIIDFVEELKWKLSAVKS